MNLLTQTYRRVQRLLGPDIWFSSLVLTILVALELAGRLLAVSDGHDMLAVFALALVVAAVGVRHQREPVEWVSALLTPLRRAAAVLRRFAFEIGIDLRGTPPLPHGYPPTAMWLLAGFSAWFLLILLLPDAFPVGLRTLATRVCYLGYLVGLVTLWTLLVAAIGASLFLPWALLHDALITSRFARGRWRRHCELFGFAAYLVATSLAATFLPLWIPLVLCLSALALNLATIAIPSNPDVKFIWRPGGEEVRCLSWGRWVTIEFSMLTLAVLNLALTACGSLALGSGPSPARESMGITLLIGQMLAWLAPGAIGALVLQTVMGRLRDPARPCRPVLHVTGADLKPQREELRRKLTELGWDMRLVPAQPQPTDVCVELTDAADTARRPGWPLQLTVAELTQPEVQERLRRRDEIQNRRRLVSGLQTLFKRAARKKYKNGSGFWVAPHYWFINGLIRDEHEEELDFNESTLWSGIIGPAYHQVLPRASRHHLYRILRALQIDLIFVEDGVGFRRFCRVLRLMFELFDIYGGRRRADEMHFQGVPGTRVMIHEFVLQEPFKSDIYPEPEFENLGRARLLHIFRDRGEYSERIEPPGDFTDVPQPAAAW